jgi:hypothetical protein
MPCSRKVILELMEGASHDPISQIERLLNTITMMDIDIYVENSLESFKQLKDGQHAIVYIAKSGCL